MYRLIALSILLFLLIPQNSSAQDSKSPLIVKFLAEGGIEFGGDEILEVVFTNGDDQTMRAGQGGYLSVGGQLQFAQLQALLLRASIGIKYNTTAADNANIRFTRLPFHFIPSWLIKNDFRVGVGIATHLNVSFKGDGFVKDENFTSNVGPRIELGYKWAALTYTALNYESEMGEKISGSSVGVSVSFTFPK